MKKRHSTDEIVKKLHAAVGPPRRAAESAKMAVDTPHRSRKTPIERYAVAVTAAIWKIPEHGKGTAMRRGREGARLTSGSVLMLALVVAACFFSGCTTTKVGPQVPENPLPRIAGAAKDNVGRNGSGHPNRETYTVDATHSAALFRVKHFDISLVAGRFTDISGTIVADRDNPNKSSVEVVIKTASVNTDLKARDKHLRNADFLDVKKFPVMSFKSKRVKKLTEDVGEVTGSFTLHGVTRTITTTVTFLGETDVPWGQHRAGFKTAFNVKRSDYGMDKLLGPAGDDIQITLLVEAKRVDESEKKSAE